MGALCRDTYCLFALYLRKRGKMQIEEISINNKEYPEQLRNIYDPPKKIYVLGNKEILKQKGIAIVGSRRCSEYGKRVSLKISKELSEKGINIISGLAIGIDTYAHLGNLQAQLGVKKIYKCSQTKMDYNVGKTIAVLGSGIDEIYPRENRDLAISIIKTGGCIVSEYPIGTKIERKNFPERNRIISGLSTGVLIVEAAERSGALITAEFALEEGKEVFAVPGNIFSKTSAGTNKLIKDGAKIIISSQDITEEIV